MPSDPIVLGFDTSDAYCAAALLSGDKVWAERFEPRARGQAEMLFPLIETMLAEEGVDWPDLGLIGVGVGPGNFTGTRISVSAARGLALALNIPAIGVTAFEVMRGAVSARDQRPALVSLSGPRNTVYLQSFDKGGAVGNPQQVALWRDEIHLEDSAPEEVTGYEAGEVAHYLNQTRDGRLQIRAFNAELHDIGATVVRIALDKWRSGSLSDARPSPVYVRPADAAPPREAPPVILP